MKRGVAFNDSPITEGGERCCQPMGEEERAILDDQNKVATWTKWGVYILADNAKLQVAARFELGTRIKQLFYLYIYLRPAVSSTRV